ncbi:metabotropic glutamate receptor 1-like isoform X2 [Penaeus japonicus]|uniref:metabotropic glutamate receptor 1-like isoform X2 n=1 Tax=Penaeus japonicus TaxID=27405 RepID=UPI001C70FDE3|nr:metabotropic glutamate receptor 1-like isoform X2 [Penaeus japonicus]XP_042891183.1 metabotropic glutamate receptor 1-like isoform X2 [Penaeus japonicus]
MEEFSDLTTEYFADVSFSEDVLGQSSTTPSAVEDGDMDGDGGTTPINSSSLSGSYLRTAPWVVPLLAVAATNAAAIVAFEVYVLVRALHGTPSRRHLFLGQCLLLGLLMCSLSGLPIALTPTPLSCGATRLLVGVSSALVFAALLVKCVFLISLNSGVYLPAHYQGLLLFFIVLVQVSVNIQWQCSYPAAVTVVRDEVSGQLHLSCVASYRQFLLSLIYVIILIIAVAALAIKCRGIRENYREASYIGAALGLVLPLWLSWTLAGLILPASVQPACLGFGMVATATIVFVVMFIPKGRQLAAVGKEGLYKEDRDDRMSTLSGGARYSPSFFLFKPIKPPKEILRPANSIYKTHFSGVSRGDEGVYTSIERPAPEFAVSSNPNFYLFRSHSHAGMMY